jgi:hypothetical protein
MKNSYRKKLEKACNYLREVYEDLETDGSDDFDEYGTRLEDIAGEIDDILEDDETRSKDEEDDDRDDDE